jgi:putative endopeptidase
LKAFEGNGRRESAAGWRAAPMVFTLAAVVLAAAPAVSMSADGAGDAQQGVAKSGTGPLGYSVQHMDRSADPRKDFYRFAVGGWLKRTPIPAADADVGGFTLLKANLDAQLNRLIQDAMKANAPAGSPRQQVGDFYRAAMDLKRLDEVGLAPLADDLKRLDGVADAATRGAFSARLELAYGISPMVNAFPAPDFKDSSMNVLNLIPGIQSLEQDEYAKPEGQRIRDLYVEYMTRMFQATGDGAEQAAANARTVLQLETELAGARLTPLQRRDPAMTYNVMTLDEAQALVPALDLKAMLGGLGVPLPEKVVVTDVGGLRGIQKVLAERPPQDIRTLLRWHMLTSRASLLGQPWRGLDQEFTRQRKGLEVAEPREREITRLIDTQLFHPLSRLYVESYFPESTRQDILRMVGHIRSEFEKRLRANSWLDKPTRDAALEKLARVDIQVGYPERWIDFSSVVIRADDHYGNVRRVGEFLARRELAKAGQPVVRERFATPPYTTPTSVNAAYNPQTNSIDITAAIVQPPFYMPGADAAVNYCSIGAVIGHELTHGFDSFGRQFGPAGNLRDWWTPEAAEEFKKRTAVLVDQYGKFEVLPGLMHNGALTVTENTADLGGITLAHAALQRELAGKPGRRIDGLSADQRCFVAWAQMWAYKARPERLRLLVSTDYHSVSSVRAFAPLVHLDAFHKAFGIRKGDPMWRAPEERVRIW